MTKMEFVHWQTSTHWVGHFVEYPDYMTQGETLDELRENLRDLYADLTSGELPGIRKVDELVVA